MQKAQFRLTLQEPFTNKKRKKTLFELLQAMAIAKMSWVNLQRDIKWLLLPRPHYPCRTVTSVRSGGIGETPDNEHTHTRMRGKISMHMFPAIVLRAKSQIRLVQVAWFSSLFPSLFFHFPVFHSHSFFPLCIFLSDCIIDWLFL